jgi:hypothetical protein
MKAGMHPFRAVGRRATRPVCPRYHSHPLYSGSHRMKRLCPHPKHPLQQAEPNLRTSTGDPPSSSMSSWLISNRLSPSKYRLDGIGMIRPLRPAKGLTNALRKQQGTSIHARWNLQARTIHSSRPLGNIPQWPNPPMPQPSVTPLDPSDPHHSGHKRSRSDKSSFWKEWANSASFQAALTTVVGLGMVFGAGVGYLEWYKAHVLHRVS